MPGHGHRGSFWREPASALTAGYHLSFTVAAFLLVAAVVIAAFVLRRPDRQEQEETAAAAPEPAY